MTPQQCLNGLDENHFQFITGVPDSIFRELLLEINQDYRFHHVIANNEGESCALAAGYHLATGKVPVVYMQNSGLGNCINPLTSLLDANIYSIPALLLIAWRGLPGEIDEPQHIKMGAILPGMLSLLDIPYVIANNDPQHLTKQLKNAADHFHKFNKPYAILFPKNVIAAAENQNRSLVIPENCIVRENLIHHLALHSQPNDIFITTTGKTSRELYEIRAQLKQDHSQDFYTVGSMGCASSVALGIAMHKRKNRVILIDGDGACLMRMEALVTIGSIHPINLLHIIIDNNAYESTGSQKTLSNSVDFVQIAMACHYRASKSINHLKDFADALIEFKQGPELWVIKTTPYSRPGLGRPKTTPIENKQALMQRLGVA